MIIKNSLRLTFEPAVTAKECFSDSLPQSSPRNCFYNWRQTEPIHGESRSLHCDLNETTVRLCFG